MPPAPSAASTSPIAFVGAAAGAGLGILGLTLWKETPKRESFVRVTGGPASVGVTGAF